MTERDDTDPADWLAQQFGEDPEPPRRRASEPTPPPVATPPIAPPAASTGGGFSWGLTPGGSTSPEPASAPPRAVEPPDAAPADWDTPTVASPVLPADWDTPTVASPVLPAAPQYPPTVAYPAAEVARQEFPGFGASVDPALDGATELLSPVGLPTPEDEGVDTSAIDSLFGDNSFVDYGDEPVIAVPVRRSSSAVAVVDRQKPPVTREPLPRLQKILFGIAGGLLAALALVALYLLGTRIGQAAPAAVAAPSSSPSASAAPVDPAAMPAGPVAVGEHNWNDLLGGECLAPYESPWQDNYTVVDCSTPHPAQLVSRALFPDAADSAYPGVEELQKRIALLCSTPEIIDYAAIAGAADVEIAASYPATEQDWADGNRTYFCFVSRTGGAELTTSVAVPQA